MRFLTFFILGVNVFTSTVNTIIADKEESTETHKSYMQVCACLIDTSQLFFCFSIQ